jgi:hypothetical protein
MVDDDHVDDDGSSTSISGEGSMSKKIAGAGMAIGLVVGAGAGLILEMSGAAGASSGASALRAVVDSTPGSTIPGDTTIVPSGSAVPADPNAPAPTPATKPDPAKRLQEILQPLIDDGTITQAQADKVIAAIDAARPPRPMGGDRRGAAGPIGFGLDVVAKALGITTADVKTALQGGQSLGDLAVSKGKTAQDVIDAIVAAATTKVTAQVTAGDLTQAEADKILAEVTARAGDFVNMKLPAGLPGFGGPGMGGRGFGGPGKGRGPGQPDNDGAGANAPAVTTPTTVTG